jgi:hypothetical protein
MDRTEINTNTALCSSSQVLLGKPKPCPSLLRNTAAHNERHESGPFLLHSTQRDLPLQLVSSTYVSPTTSFRSTYSAHFLSHNLFIALKIMMNSINPQAPRYVIFFNHVSLAGPYIQHPQYKKNVSHSRQTTGKASTLYLCYNA